MERLSFSLQGTADQFLIDGQLLTQNFENACNEASQKASFRMQKDYDHSYYFIASFMADHVAHHAKILKQ